MAYSFRNIQYLFEKCLCFFCRRKGVVKYSRNETHVVQNYTGIARHCYRKWASAQTSFREK